MAELKKCQCGCGSMKFRMLSVKELIVDFERESMPGHPMLTPGSEQFMSLRCVKCGKPVESYDADLMRKEIL